MTDKKILWTLQFYESYLNGRYIAYKADTDFKPIGNKPYEHILYMIPQIREFLAQGRKEKAFRWLGFIQGVLWEKGDFSLEGLKNHNRPGCDGEVPKMKRS